MSDDSTITQAGGSITYTLSYTNLGDRVATGVVITDHLSSLTALAGTPINTGWRASATAGLYTYNVGELLPGATGSVELAASVAISLPGSSGVITNSAEIGDDGRYGTDPSPQNNAAQTLTQWRTVADLSITKIAAPDPVNAGRVLTYTLVAQNRGPSIAVGVRITDSMPSGMAQIGRDGLQLALPLTEAESPYLDRSGSGHNALCTGSVSVCPQGMNGHSTTAVLFDGVNDGLQTSALFTDVVNNFTIEAWVLPTAAHQIDSESTSGEGGTYGQRYLISPMHGGALGGNNHAGAGMSVGTNGVSIYEHTTGYVPALLVWTAPEPLIGWTHVAVVYENKRPTLFINGIAVHSGLTSGKDFVHPSAMELGRGLNGSLDGSFAGGAGDIVIYGRALTAAEIAYDSASPPAGLIRTSQGGCQVIDSVICDGGMLAPGASVTVTVPVVAAGNLAGTITNTAVVTAQAIDPVPANNTVTATAVVVQPVPGDLVIESLSAPPSVHVTEPVTVEVRVKNRGLGDIEAPFATGWYRDPPTIPVSVTLPTGVWYTETLNAGDSVTFIHVYSPTSPGISEIYAFADAVTAQAMLTVDNAYTLSVNCQVVGSGAGLGEASRYDITPYLHDGRNVVTIDGVNAGGPGGAIFDAGLPNGRALVSNSFWRYSLSREPGACEANYDDSSWPMAVEYGGYGSAPWGLNPTQMASSEARWIWAANQNAIQVYLRRVVDIPFRSWGLIQETNESNNRSAAITVTVTGPTPVQGSILTDTTWSLLGSPYIVTGDVTVAPGVSLTVEPGVVVSFTNGSGLRVAGSLNAQPKPPASIALDASSGPWGIAVDDSEHRAFVANHDNNTLAVLDTLSHSQILTIPVGLNPIGVALDEVNDRIYVTSAGDGHFLALDRASMAPVADYRIGGAPAGVAYARDYRLALVALSADNAVAVVDARNLSTTQTIPVGCNPRSVAYNPANQSAYVTNYCDGTVSVLALSPQITVTEVISVGLGPWKMAVDPIGNRVFVLNDGESSVSVIDGADNRVIAGFPVEGGASGAAYDTLNDYFYVSHWRSNTLTKMDGTSYAVLTTLPTGGFPVDVALVQSTHEVLVSSSTTDEVTVHQIGDVADASAPVVFTSQAPSPTPGDWRGIVFEAGSQGWLRNARIEYAGASGYGLLLRSNDVTILNDLVRATMGDGIRVEGAAPRIGGTTVANSTGNGLRTQSRATPEIWGNHLLTNTTSAASIDLSSFPVFRGNQALDNGTDGIRVDGGEMAYSGVWHSEGSMPYVLPDGFVVNQGVTLTIAAGYVDEIGGTALKFGQSRQILVNGTLIVSGLPGQPVVFTSLPDDEYGGDTDNSGPSVGAAGYWQGLAVASSGRVTLAHALMRYGGFFACGSGGCWGADAMIKVDGGRLDVSDSTISSSGSAYYGAIYALNNAAVDIRNSFIADNPYNGVQLMRVRSAVLAGNTFRRNQYGVYYYSTDISGLTLTGNHFVTNTVAAGLLVFNTAGGSPVISGNSVEDNAVNGLHITGSVSGASTLPVDLPYVVYQGFSIDAGGVLTLPAGSILKFVSGTTLSINGTLTAAGLPGQPVVFTSLPDDEYGGDTDNSGPSVGAAGYWQGLAVASSGRVTLAHALVRYGGFFACGSGGCWGADAMIKVDGGRLDVSDSTISSSGSAYYGAIYALNNAAVDIRNSFIADNLRNGISLRDVAPVIVNNCIVNNGLYGIENASVSRIPAPDNYWGGRPSPFGAANGVNFDQSCTPGNPPECIVTLYRVDPWMWLPSCPLN